MIEIILMAVALYLALGLVCTGILHGTGLARIDAGVKGAGWWFRILITPGLVALWPVLLSKGRRASQGKDPAGRADRPISPQGLRGSHRVLATSLLILLPLAVTAGLLVRPDLPSVEADALVRRELPEPLPEVLMEQAGSVGQADGVWKILGDGAGQRQVELSLNRDAALPALALFWAPMDDPSQNQSPPAGAVFLGLVSGPGLFRFPLEEAEGGVLIVDSLARQERVATINGGQP